MINFKEFVYILGVVCKADITHKLKLLYTCHQPPALLPTDILEEESGDAPVSPVSVASTDVAEEATDFFTDDKSLTDSTKDEIELPGDFIEEDVPVEEPEELGTNDFGIGNNGEQKSSEEQPSDNSQEIGSSQETEKTGAEGDGSSVKSLGAEGNGFSVEVPEAGGYYKATDIQYSYRKMAEKKRELNRSDSKADLKNVPRLTQVQFIQLWKTLYDMFHDHPHEQQLYHSIATVGTLLLEIGEVGKRFYLKSVSESSQGEGSVSVSEVDSVAAYVKNVTIDSSPSKNSGSSETKDSAEKSNCNDDSSSAMSGENSNVTQQDSGISEQSADSLQSSTSDSSSQPHSKPDSDWSISFEQFIASMLTEQPLVEYFEKIIDITEDIAKMRNRRLLTRQQSTWETQKQNSKK
ncbi:TBC1D8_9 [Mytilus coruscus]|uniref:TBC1D8_9 n=1 Tax=Mytilus coruscus TaxID=42192 RepID=A0A6J7ZY33_MYTCO|nr:TBC1D8_9 [Mytilus coruscus]